jgi:hypothetical protein
MSALAEFEGRLPPDLRAAFRGLSSPAAVQEYLEGLAYIAEDRDRSPLNVMIDRQAHCLDGAFFAALALRRIGHRPLVLDLVPVPGLDDDHVLAVFRVDGLWGAVAKSNFTGLRYREPVYRDLHELAISYFEDYYAINLERSLRAYTRPLDLSRFDSTGWMWDEAAVGPVVKRFYRSRPIPLFPESAAARLTLADERSFKAASLGTNFEWVYGVRKNP